MREWPILLNYLNKESLAQIDLAFADSVLKKLKSREEAHAALLAVLLALSRLGHLTLNISEEGITSALQLLDIEEPLPLASLVRKGIDTFPAQGMADVQNENAIKPSTWICKSAPLVYLQKNWVCETEILTQLKRLASSPKIALSEQWTPDPRLNALQLQAVQQGIQHTLSLLTGGPGTGKTFTAAQLVSACLAALPTLQRSAFRIILTAPTGKAVAHLEGNLRKAMGEEVKVRSGTLHAILGIKNHGRKEELQPLFADLVIVDECSMIDAAIFAKLLAAITTGTRVIFIGDQDQLPPVEAGSIFADLVDSGNFPTTKLSVSLRSDRTEILALAQAIKEGNADKALSFLSERIEWTDLEEDAPAISQLYAQLWERCKDHFPRASLEKPVSEEIIAKLGEFILLSCMRQGALGVDALNRHFLHQSLAQVSEDSWWIAPLMMTRNDHNLQLFNGDVGIMVRKVGADFSLRQLRSEDYAVFKDRKGGLRTIPALALDAFEYSYCLSVHKSQGSEYDEALVLVPKGSERFGREALYTAVTRVKTKLCIAANKETLRRAIAASSRKISGIDIRLKTF